jgi:predicted transcriptional regulator of viral defense system
MDVQVVGHSPPDQRIAHIAARQHGVVTRAQLLSIGVTRGGIDKRLRRGALHAVHRGVYAVRHPALARRGDYMAAVIALGPGAALSHAGAAALWELRPERSPRIDVTVPTAGGRATRRLIVVHRALISMNEIAVRDGIPVTTPARTLLDLADVLGQRPLERALDEAEHRAGSTWTRTELEERMLALCRRAGLPAPAVNTDVQGFEADFAWSSGRLVVETDGWQAHRTRRAFERDRSATPSSSRPAGGWSGSRADGSPQSRARSPRSSPGYSPSIRSQERPPSCPPYR